MVRKASGLVLILLLFVASAASAQSLSTKALKVDFGAIEIAAPAATVDFTPAPAARRGGTTTWSGLVFGGFTTVSDFALAIGGGVQGTNFMNNEKYGLQVDFQYAKLADCDFSLVIGDCSLSQFAFSGAFLYLFNEMTNGWRPYAGGGIVFSRWSFSYSDGFVCGELIDCDASDTNGGIQIQGGVMKNRLLLEGRIQSVGGGGFLGLVGYKFGGGN
jgi:hypothetical protein